MKTGFLVGKFAPLHNGHIHFIYESAKNVDSLVVILSNDPKWLSKYPYSEMLQPEKRLYWLEEAFKNDDNIHIRFLDETNIPEYPHGWNEWSGMVYDILSEFGEAQYVFSSEPSYDENYKKYFPNIEHVVIDHERSKVNISATMIRDDLHSNVSHLPHIVQKDILKRG